MFRLKHPLRAPHLRVEFLERIVRAIRGFTVFKVVVNNIDDIIHFDQNTKQHWSMSYPLQKPCIVSSDGNLAPFGFTSSCEAERSFSALRLIKTWLRSTMTQKTLDNVMMCHIVWSVNRNFISISLWAANSLEKNSMCKQYFCYLYLIIICWNIIFFMHWNLK